jgi:hypothetical protein
MGSISTSSLPPAILFAWGYMPHPAYRNSPFQPTFPLLGLVRHQRHFFSACQNVRSLRQQGDAAKGRKTETIYVSAHMPCTLVMRRSVRTRANQRTAYLHVESA